ncbi:RNA polymerase-associated protein LEO1-like isoform X1 [Syngnathus scovelli]|uniref:RNA polymerase-associated protein LEO1-like isoform X1 n=1 Tax=Syngnathus scovelli TaxID=161590 RepID=UPI0035CC50DA
MDGQGDGWHNGPNSIRLPLPRGVRPPNDEPNMEFIAILDFIVNQEIIFVNGPEQWDLEDNHQNNNPIHINHGNVEDNQAELHMEVNQRMEAVERSSEQSRGHSTNEDDDDDEIRSIENPRRASTSDSDTDLDEANTEPRPGPSWQRSEDDDGDENGTRRKRPYPWWHEFHQKSSDSSPDFDFYEVNPLLCESNQSLDSQDENGDMESKPSGEFAAKAASVSNSDPAGEVSDAEERLKDFNEQEIQHESVLPPFRTSETERGSGMCCQWCHGCDNNISDQDDPEENTPAGNLDVEESTLELFNGFSEMPDSEVSQGIRTSCTVEKEDGSSDEDPQPGPSRRISGNEARSYLEMINEKRWWHEFCDNSSDSGTDWEDTEGVSLPGTSRKRCGDDDQEQAKSRISKRFRFGDDGNSDGDESEAERNESNEDLNSHDSKEKKRLRWQDDLRRKCSSSRCVKYVPEEFAAEEQDQPSVEMLPQVEKSYGESSDSTDSNALEAPPLKLSLRDNLALLSLSSHVSQSKCVKFQEETTSQASEQDLEDHPPPIQSHETLTENGRSDFDMDEKR